MTPQERFAVNLRKARVAAGVSQEELGYMCDLHRTEVSLLERAGREPRMATIVKLSGALDTSVADLCEGVSWLPKAKRFEVKRPPKTPGK
jgi:transcriptional regulator with XRE-family HTH domain